MILHLFCHLFPFSLIYKLVLQDVLLTTGEGCTCDLRRGATARSMLFSSCQGRYFSIIKGFAILYASEIVSFSSYSVIILTRSRSADHRQLVVDYYSDLFNSNRITRC